MFYTIYKITNVLNQKYYIGMHKTKKLDDGYMGSGKLIRKAIKKYGIENFRKEILHVFNNELDMRNKEKELVVLSENSYNLLEGGHGGFGYINLNNLRVQRHFTQEDVKKGNRYLIENEIVKKNHQEGKMKHTYFVSGSDNHKKIIQSANSEESIIKKKITFQKNNHQKGLKNSQYGTWWMTNGQVNKKIKKQEVDKFIELGYYQGRKIVVGTQI